MLRLTYIRSNERAVLYRRGEPRRLLRTGWNLVPCWPLRAEVKRFDASAPWLQLGSANALRELIASGVLGDAVHTIDLSDGERAFVWLDGRFAGIAGAGLAAAWRAPRSLEVERVALTEGRIENQRLRVILDAVASGRSEVFGRELVQLVDTAAETLSLVYRNGALLDQLGPGRAGYWTGVGRLTVVGVDLREQVLDVAGQELMTADKVTLRLNASLSYRVRDAVLAQSISQDSGQSLYREAQLALRAVVGSRELEALLAEREAISGELEELVAQRAASMGLELVSLGIRDVILPGEMKTILNRVMEAKRAAEANLITRREETAAMRSQANTAKMLEQSPTLMRLRELEVLEKIADQANLQVVLSEGGLTDRLMKLV